MFTKQTHRKKLLILWIEIIFNGLFRRTTRPMTTGGIFHRGGMYPKTMSYKKQGGEHVISQIVISL